MLRYIHHATICPLIQGSGPDRCASSIGSWGSVVEWQRLDSEGSRRGLRPIAKSMSTSQGGGNMGKSLRLVVVLAMVFSVGLVASLSQAQDAGKTIVRVRGANTMATMIDKLARAYMGDHPNCSVAVSGGGMQEGFKCLLEKTADVAMASREMNAQEKALVAQKKGMKLVEQLIGWDAIAIIAHPANPVKELTVDQIIKIFLGEWTDWNDVGGEILPIVLYVGDATRSGMAQYINESILKGPPPYANPRRYYPSVIKDVSSRADAAGYTPLGIATAAQKQGSKNIGDQERCSITCDYAVSRDNCEPLLPTAEAAVSFI